MDVDLRAELAEWPTGSALRGYCCVPVNPVAAVLVVHGFGEHAGRHAKTMRAWAARGLAAYAYDHRGHGHSPGARAVVTRFDDLVDDAIELRRRILSEHPELPLFIFGMSMGGLIATRSAQRTSDGIRGIVLLAPSFAVAEHIPPFVRGLLKRLRKIAPGFKLQPLAASALSRDPAVGEAYRTDPLTYHGGVTLVSATEIVDAGEAAIADAAGHLVPTLLLQGDADKLASPIGATRFVQAARNNLDLTHTVVPGGYHELFNEPGGASLAETAADWMLARVHNCGSS